MSSAWDPHLYLRFAGERERPFWELVGRVPLHAPRYVADLGCGPGTATAGLCWRWPGAQVVGVDSSLPMIEQARELAAPGRLSFVHGDLRTWVPPVAPDLVLSNAALQWVPGHTGLFGGWLSALAPGGVFAFSVPGNFDAPSHALLQELAASSRWAGQLAGARPGSEILDPGEYLDILSGLGAAVDAWETTYCQVLSGPDPVLEWVRGTALRPYLARLEPADATRFTDQYRARLAEAYPPNAQGLTVFPFRRVFVVAQAPRSSAPGPA